MYEKSKNKAQRYHSSLQHQEHLYFVALKQQTMYSKTYPLILLAALFCLASCGSSDTTDTVDLQEETISTSTTVAPQEEAPAALETFAMGLTSGPEASKKLLSEMAVIELRDHEIGTHTFTSVELDNHNEAGCYTLYLIGEVEDREYKACFFDEKVTALELIGTYTEQ